MLDLVIPADVRAALSRADGAAVALLCLCWGLMGWLSEHPFARAPSVTVLMAEVQREWMRGFVRRDLM